MSAATAAPGPHVAALGPDRFRPLLSEALDIYVTAMRYPPGTARQRGPMWLEHMLRPDWRCVGAFEEDQLVGVGYGYRGAPGQWWHDEVHRGIVTSNPSALDWLEEYFELTELHVHPDAQGRGTGAALLRRLLAEVDAPRVLLSTPEGPTRAWRLYRSLGFVDLLRRYRFTGDPRPFGVLGRELPL